jgi:hypothetical protein
MATLCITLHGTLGLVGLGGGIGGESVGFFGVAKLATAVVLVDAVLRLGVFSFVSLLPPVREAGLVGGRVPVPPPLNRRLGVGRMLALRRFLRRLLLEHDPTALSRRRVLNGLHLALQPGNFCGRSTIALREQ